MKGWGKVRDVAEYTSLSTRTIRALLHRGLKHSRLGPSGAILIRFTDVDAYLDKLANTSDKVDEMVSKIVKEVAGRG